MNNGIEILLINATPHEQDIFSFALNDLHMRYTCRFANNIKDAAKKMSTIIPDYVFIDLKQTQPGKFINLKQIRKITRFKNPRVIVRAEDNTTVSSDKALQLGACMCINKTSMISDLIFMLKEILVKNNSIPALHN